MVAIEQADGDDFAIARISSAAFGGFGVEYASSKSRVAQPTFRARLVCGGRRRKP